MVKDDATPPSTAAKKRKPQPRPLTSLATPNSNAKNQTHHSALRNSKYPNSIIEESGIRRSTRPKPILDGTWSALDFIDDEDEEEEDDEDEREMKKQKLVQRLKSQPVTRSAPEAEVVMMERIADEGESEAEDRSGKVSSAADGASRVLEEGAGPTTPMLAKKTILFILDRLQKKDTHGVFSEPVDPEELPDYHEIIDNPMDFSTVRKKLDNGAYQTLEKFEEDIFLICSNALHYNSPSTVYFRKARTIQELAKRDFGNLRQKGEDGVPQPRVIRRGRPPKTIEKSPEPDATQVPNSESPSAAALGSVAENSKNYNLRKGLRSLKFLTEETIFMGADDPSCNGTSAGLQEWNTEFPALILKTPYGKKPVVVDETRRDSYWQPVTNAEPASNMLTTEPKRLLPVGVGMTEQHVYLSRLSRFAAGLGPLAWQIALKKIKQSLAPNVEFDPFQFAYENPKFAVYEVDANLIPVIPTASNNTFTKTSRVINVKEARMENEDEPSQDPKQPESCKCDDIKSLPIDPTEANGNYRSV